MPTKREREYYRMGFKDGRDYAIGGDEKDPQATVMGRYSPAKVKRRKLSAWNKYVKANSKKPRFRMRSGKLNLKKMAVAFRKTPAGKKRRK